MIINNILKMNLLIIAVVILIIIMAWSYWDDKEQLIAIIPTRISDNIHNVIKKNKNKAK